MLAVTITGRPKPFGGGGGGAGLGVSGGGGLMRSARVLVGDPGGAQAELVLPFDTRWVGVWWWGVGGDGVGLGGRSVF